MNDLLSPEPIASKSPTASPTPQRAVRLTIPFLVFLLPLILYFRTLCPTIYPGDGPELTTAAWCLGIPHPTGYPLFMILGFLFEHAGLGSPAFGMNIMVALFGALACLGVYRLQREIWRIMLGRRRAGSLSFRCAAAGVALLMGAGATWWDQSSETEVYTLLLVFVSFGWTVALRLIRHPSRQGLWALAFLSGLAFLHHMLYVVTFPIALMGFIAWWGHLRRTDSPSALAKFTRTFAIAILLFLIPLTLYAYLPLRALALPPMNWGNPQGIQGVLWHLTGKQYTGTHILSRPNGEKLSPDEIPDHIRARLAQLAHWGGTQYLPDDPERPYRGRMFVLLACLFAGLGLVCLWRRSPLAALGFLFGIALNTVLVVIYTIKDIEAYQLPLWIFVATLAILGPVAVAHFFPDRYPDPAVAKRCWHLRGWVATVITSALAVTAIFEWYPPEKGINKSAASSAYRYADTLMRIVPRNTIIFTFGDYDIFPLWYIQVCEKRRPDVAVIGSNFIFNKWYGEMLRATLPTGVSVYIGDEPPPKNKEHWTNAFLGGMVAPALKTGRPVYFTFYDADVMGFFQLRTYVVPSPFPLSQMNKSNSSVNKTSDKMPICEITDPNDYAKTALQNFAREFPGETMRLVSRAKPEVGNDRK